MRKVLVIGSPGAGKSTFARRLGEITRLHVVHLDRHFWNSGWVETPRDEWSERVAELLKGDSWIIDGNYSGTMNMRLAACDTVIFLDMPRLLCTWRVLKRRLQYNGRTRPDLPPGCPERFDLEFLFWTWNYPERSRQRVDARLEALPASATVHRLTSTRAAEQFLDSVAAQRA